MLLGAGQPREASYAFERAEALSPGDPVAHLGRVEVLLEVDKPEEALGTLELIGPIPPASRALFHRLRGLALSRLSRFEEAEPELLKGRGARTSGPDPWMKEVAALKVGASAILLQANRKIESGQLEAALQQLRLLEEGDPDDPRIFVQKGRVLDRLGDWSGSAAALSRASELSPDDLGLALAMASAMVKAGEVDGALVAAERLIELDPQSAGAHELRADLYLGEGRGQDAMAAVAHSRELGVQTASLEVTAGKAALEMGDAARALPAFEAAISLDPASADGLAGKALAALGLGEGAVATAAVEALAASIAAMNVASDSWLERITSASTWQIRSLWDSKPEERSFADSTRASSNSSGSASTSSRKGITLSSSFTAISSTMRTLAPSTASKRNSSIWFSIVSMVSPPGR